jgi:hypothetical protein
MAAFASLGYPVSNLGLLDSRFAFGDGRRCLSPLGFPLRVFRDTSSPLYAALSTGSESQTVGGRDPSTMTAYHCASCTMWETSPACVYYAEPKLRPYPSFESVCRSNSEVESDIGPGIRSHIPSELTHTKEAWDCVELNFGGSMPKRRCSRWVRTDVHGSIIAQPKLGTVIVKDPRLAADYPGKVQFWGFSQTSILEDFADGARAAPALGPTAKAPIDRAGRFW